MQIRHYTIATAGHVDHGKSSLVKALTSIDPDRLPEEKARGITIDLGFAHLELDTPAAAPDAKPARWRIGIVDVPGHEDFVKNMVAGVGSIDLALLIVAADDGWMPQTEEHLHILLYLGVTRAVVALTKADLCSDESAAIQALREQLRGTPFADAPIVPTSTVNGRGIEELKATLAALLGRLPPPRDIGKPRLPVDRVFTLRGFGTVVTGTLTGGSLRRNQPVVIQPSGLATRLRSLQTHNRETESSAPGARTALNLPDVANAAAGGEGVRRGDVITLPDLGKPALNVDARVERSARLAGRESKGARPLKDGARVRIHAGSGNWPARLHLLDTNTLLPGQSALAQVRFEEPQFLLAGDRFIVRDWPEQATLAGGLVLDPVADKRGFHSGARKRFLEARAAQPLDAGAWVRTQLERDGVARAAGLLRQSRFSDEEVQSALSRLVAQGEAVAIGELVAGGGFWQRLAARAAAAIDAFHKEHPERGGLPAADLRAALAKELRNGGMFEALVKHLCANGFVQAGVALRRAAHRPSLPPHLQAAGAKLRATLAARPVDPPSRKELAPDTASQQALRFLIDSGEVVELSLDIVLASDAFARAVDTIKASLRARGQATVSELRQTLGTSRRVMMPLLERLDRTGVTARQGDVRVLGRNA